MRSDIAKAVFERPKAGRTWAKKTPRAEPLVLDAAGEQPDEASGRGIKRQKMGNCRLSPVERFLVRNSRLGIEIRACVGWMLLRSREAA